MNIDMNKQDYIYYKNKKGIVIYHVPSKRRIILDEKYTERVIDYLDKNKEDMEFYEFLVNTFDEEKKNKDNIVNIELMTANTCNLSCKYCYANVSIPLSEVHAIRYRSPHNPLKKSIFF